MVKRQFDTKRYVIVGFITLLLFSLGIALGVIFSNARVSSAERLAKSQEADFKELQFQSIYMNTLQKSNYNCNVLRIAIEKSMNDLSKSLKTFSAYKEKSVATDSYEIELISRNYLLDNLRYWLFAKESKELCDLDTVNILYFYSDTNCEMCSDQGVVLTYFKDLLGDKILIFPIDADLEPTDAIITILKSRYNITELPAIVIEDTTYVGIQKKNELEPLICNGYKNNTTCYK